MPAPDDRTQPTGPDMTSPDMTSTEAAGTRTLPRPRTPEGRAGLAALLREPARALIALDFDGTLSPIVADPAAAHAHPAAAAALSRLAAAVGTLAVITGRPAAVAVELGGLAGVPGLIVLGHYGWERWQDGALASPGARPGSRPPATNCLPSWPVPAPPRVPGPRTRGSRWPCTPVAPRTPRARSRCCAAR